MHPSALQQQTGELGKEGGTNGDSEHLAEEAEPVKVDLAERSEGAAGRDEGDGEEGGAVEAWYWKAGRGTMSDQPLAGLPYSRTQGRKKNSRKRTSQPAHSAHH